MSAEPTRRLDPVRLLTGAGTLALALMLFATIADIIARLAFNRPFHGTLDLVEVTLVLVAFLALPDCFRRDDQIKVDVFDVAAGPRGLAIMRLAGEVATLAFLLLLAVTVISPLVDAYRFGDAKPDLPVPIFALLAAIELALVVSVVVVAGRLVAQQRDFRRAGTQVALPTDGSNGAVP